MDGVDQELSILGVLLVVLVHSFGEFLLQEQDNILDIFAGYHLERDAEGLPSHINIGTGQHSQNLHNQIVQDTLILLTQLVNSVKHNKLDVVVRLLDAKLDELASGGFDSDGVCSEGS